MSEKTKQRIIKAGAELIHKQGFNNTGLKDILAAAQVPKGSFYFYFKNKEQFGIEVIDYYKERFRESVLIILSDQSIPPLVRMRHFFQHYHDIMKSNGYKRGCPIGNLTQEMGDLSEAFRFKLKQSLDGMATTIESLLKESIERGDTPKLNTRTTAIFIIEAWHGALIRMKATEDDEPLSIFYSFIFGTILRK
ncbi:TetR/AcrR family transcriptional regulator [Pseudodesulfovibrio piezophilus]|uniref:Transcriptional regulator, TetR family n=1 Tax=Pseudodesulfovibrio piezophilus (strain DSM 21447 / JCM 15486 / C1TLV30) TaxID=1322246 RepID=M1WMX6_PSEP2|nr:TetR/AcrR family transcriptional regulator [Pseudodesulfovibrio piezophilus]CCH47259.1 Transcriptional regulator, TetR family [Pseudodesulfovibrio piezophilus C1TLV30]